MAEERTGLIVRWVAAVGKGRPFAPRVPSRTARQLTPPGLPASLHMCIRSRADAEHMSLWEDLWVG